MPETIVLPPEDIRDFVAIQHDADGKIRVKVVEAKKHITSVQRYLTLLRSAIREKSANSILPLLTLSQP